MDTIHFSHPVTAANSHLERTQKKSAVNMRLGDMCDLTYCSALASPK